MSIHAYVFVECTLGKATHVAEALMKVPGVETAHAVTGTYDVIAFVRADNVAVLGDLLSSGIHRLPGVLKTTTNVVVEPGAAPGSARTDRERPT
jgi:DNA-binding Lrp family transcriptional regulator